MGRRGPKRTPTAVLKIRGSWLATDRSDAGERGVGELPAPPAWLSEASRAQWHHIGQWLVGWGVMLDRYEPGLAELCDAYAQFIAVTEAAHGQPFWTETDKGGIKPHPVWAEKDRAAKRLKDSLSRYGLTPAAASSVKVEEAPKQTGLDGLKLRA